MAGPDGIDAHLLKQLDLSLECASVDGRAQGAEVVMITYAVEPDVFTIQEKSLVGVELDRPNAEVGLISVNTLAVQLNGYNGHVEVGLSDTPQLWSTDLHG